jgi:hypothetical protein
VVFLTSLKFAAVVLTAKREVYYYLSLAPEICFPQTLQVCNIGENWIGREVGAPAAWEVRNPYSNALYEAPALPHHVQLR